MFKCLNCAWVFEEEEMSSFEEHHGDDFYETVSCCPHCGWDDYEEAVKCSVCGEWHTESEGKYSEMCDECLNEAKFLYRYDAKKCFDLSKDEKDSVEINSFLLSQFSVEEIERILLNELTWEQRTPYSDYINFIEDEEWWFVEKILEGGEKVE